ncbi:MAG: AtpZ/AtpI family protein [Bacteroidales bacterium]|nr:AtpZ/AtpI family protein [Bacteroidales bacterium]MBN2756694.1 AtpZ/AtpI family protein [Bacteroidales bacterium]
MIAIILIGFFGGLELDKLFNFKILIFTIAFSLLGIFAALWLVIKDFLKK